MGQPLQLAMLATYFVAVAALIAVVLGLSHLLGQRHCAQIHPFESSVLPVGNARGKFPAQFYLIVMFFVAFDLEVAFFHARAIVAREALWASYIFVTILLAALFHRWRVGALDWTPARSCSRWPP